MVAPEGLSRRRTATRDRLLGAAAAVFAERGVQGASVEDVCERAGFTRGAFYSNFATRDDLVLALVERRAATLLERVRVAVDEAIADLGDVSGSGSRRPTPAPTAAVGAGSGSADPVAGAVSRFPFADAGDRESFLLNTELTLHALRHPPTALRVAAVRSTLRTELIRLLRGALAAGGRRLTGDPELVARLVTALYDGSAAQSFLEPAALPGGTLERQFLAPLLHALSEPPV